MPNRNETQAELALVESELRRRREESASITRMTLATGKPVAVGLGLYHQATFSSIDNLERRKKELKKRLAQ